MRRVIKAGTRDADAARMDEAALYRAIALLRAHWRVMAAAHVPGSAVAALALVLAPGTPALVAAVVVSLAGAGLAVRSAVGGIEARMLPDEAASVVPRAVAQGGLACAPAIVLVVLAQVLGAVHPLLMLPVMVLAIPVLLACSLWCGLALASVGDGDREWVPRRAFAVMRAAPVQLALTWGAGLAMLVVPALLVAFAASILQVVPGVGLVAPVLGTAVLGTLVAALCCGLWETVAESDARVRTGGDTSVLAQPAPVGSLPTTTTGRSPVTVAEPAATAQAVAATPQPVAATPQPVAGQAWQAGLDPGGSWGDWLGMPVDGMVGIQVEASNGPVPNLMLADAAGAWMQAPPPAAPGFWWVMLPEGWTWIQLASTAAESQAFAVQTWMVDGHGVQVA